MPSRILTYDFSVSRIVIASTLFDEEMKYSSPLVHLEPDAVTFVVVVKILKKEEKS